MPTVQLARGQLPAAHHVRRHCFEPLPIRLAFRAEADLIQVALTVIPAMLTAQAVLTVPRTARHAHPPTSFRRPTRPAISAGMDITFQEHTVIQIAQSPLLRPLRLRQRPFQASQTQASRPQPSFQPTLLPRLLQMVMSGWSCSIRSFQAFPQSFSPTTTFRNSF